MVKIIIDQLQVSSSKEQKKEQKTLSEIGNDRQLLSLLFTVHVQRVHVAVLARNYTRRIMRVIIIDVYGDCI